MEDILTSNVFGLFKLLPPEKALFKFLAEAIDPFAQANDEINPLAGLPASTKVSYEFWPHWQEPDSYFCEPDLVLRLAQPDGKNIIILIEAKYLSGKSSEADDSDKPLDQLAREWDNLTKVADREDASAYLVFLTADVGCPIQDIKKSKNDYGRNRPGKPFSCLWLCWQKIGDIFVNPENENLLDLVAMIKRLDLVFFTGISPLSDSPEIDWKFTYPNTQKGTSKQPRKKAKIPESFAWRSDMTTQIPWSYKA